MKKQLTYEHRDIIGQTIAPGQTVSIALNGNKVGTVVKMTRVKIRVKYYQSWASVRSGESRKHLVEYLCYPNQLLVLSENLQHELTIARLKGTL